MLLVVFINPPTTAHDDGLITRRTYAVDIRRPLFYGEVQCTHWNPVTVSMLVAIIYRHATEAVDGVDSTAEERVIVKDFIFGMSDEKTHDALVRTKPSGGTTWTREAVATVATFLAPSPACHRHLASPTTARTHHRTEGTEGCACSTYRHFASV